MSQKAGKKPPERTCIACRAVKQKSELLRVVKTPQGDIQIDPTGKMNGRGAYVCNSVECMQKCKKSKALNRAFKCNVSPETYDALTEQMK